MTKEQCMQLAGQLYDQITGGGATGDARPPKYDTALPAGPGQVVYASECSLKELQYQKSRADKPPSDPKWAEANAKRSKALGFFIAYRQAAPGECWTGQRNRETVTALPPSDRPAKYDRVAAPRVAAENLDDPEETPGYTRHVIGADDEMPF